MKLKAILFVALFAVSQLFAGSFFTYASFRTSGVASGGLRYVLNDHVCFDGSLGGEYNDGLSTDIYLDCFFYKLSVGACVFTSVPKEGAAVTSASLLYCFEKQINNDIAIDIMPSIVTKTFEKNTGVQFLSSWDIALVFKL